MEVIVKPTIRLMFEKYFGVAGQRPIQLIPRKLRFISASLALLLMATLIALPLFLILILRRQLQKITLPLKSKGV